MRWILLVAIVFCVIGHVSSSAGLAWSGQQSSRNLAQYDKAGPYIFDNEPPLARREQAAAELRTFLWEHWREQRLGLAKATFFSIEGDSATVTFYIEPDANKRWQVAVESFTSTSVLMKSRKPRRELKKENYDLLERIEATGNSLSSSIAPAEVRDGGRYKLRLTNTLTKSVRIL